MGAVQNTGLESLPAYAQVLRVLLRAFDDAEAARRPASELAIELLTLVCYQGQGSHCGR